MEGRKKKREGGRKEVRERGSVFGLEHACFVQNLHLLCTVLLTYHVTPVLAVQQQDTSESDGMIMQVMIEFEPNGACICCKVAESNPLKCTFVRTNYYLPCSFTDPQTLCHGRSSASRSSLSAAGQAHKQSNRHISYRASQLCLLPHHPRSEDLHLKYRFLLHRGRPGLRSDHADR